jgi:transcriptional regulator with XRE-family HTH domain
VTSNERTTMAKIAERSGVSLSTVSPVLRDKPSVGADTRQRVLAVARNLGYIPPKRTSMVSPCAALTDASTGRMAIYYGAADTVTCLAYAQVDELVEYVKVNSGI